MKNKEFRTLVPMKVCRRAKNYPTIVVVGPTGAGKSTLIYALINHRVVGFMQLGIGETNQTTIIPANIVFDERIEKEEHFALQIRFKGFSSKDVDIELVPLLADMFFASERDTEETLDSLDVEWFMGVLEPKSARYHLAQFFDTEELRQKLVDELKKVISEPLAEIERNYKELDFKISEMKKALADSKVGVKSIRRRAFEEMWHGLSMDILLDYVLYLDELGVEIQLELHNLTGASMNGVFESEYSTEKDDIYPYGGDILMALFNAKAPYSLIIEEITLACKPRREMLEAHNKNWPMRFVFRDSMGLNQIGIDGVSIKDALEIAVACNPDAILFLMSLEEREDVIAEVCRAIQERSQRKNDTAIPKNIIFTKPDWFISNIINKENRETVVLTQADYSANIDTAISKVDQKIARIVDTLISPDDYTWLSLRYLDEEIDPIQRALKETENDKYLRFKPEGLYGIMMEHVDDIQISRLPYGLKEAPFVTVDDDQRPAIEIKVNAGWYENIKDDIIDKLTVDKAIVNGYTITTQYRISGRSVVAYYNKLKVGLGHTTNAKVYGNFSINMKGLMNRILHMYISNIDALYGSYGVSTTVDNLSEKEADKLVEFFDKDGSISAAPLIDANPELLKTISGKKLAEQKLHRAFKVYFEDEHRFNTLLDKVAFRLSYGNEEIKEMMDTIYQKPISYDATIREMQEAYKKLFGTQHFLDIVTVEIGNVMTDMINNMFVIM